MANIKVTVDYPIANGLPLTFKSPTDCSQITGLVVCYPEGSTSTSKTFQFADAHGNNVGDIDLFAANVLVKVILDVDAAKAYVQNADTNAYIEGELAKKAPTSHNHSASNITSGTLPVARGGTGNTSVDTTPTSGSTKMVTSGGVYTALSGKAESSHTHTKSEITDFPTSMTPTAHNHAAGDITSGTLAVGRGGTGVTSNPSMLTNLGSTTAASVFAASPRPGVTGTLPVANGGTGATTFTSGAALIGAGTGAVTTRSITNSTAATTAITGSTNLVTMNTLRYAMNRTTGLGSADTNYSTSMVRGISAGTSDLTAGSSSLTSGAIYIVYE